MNTVLTHFFDASRPSRILRAVAVEKYLILGFVAAFIRTELYAPFVIDRQLTILEKGGATHSGTRTLYRY